MGKEQLKWLLDKLNSIAEEKRRDPGDMGHLYIDEVKDLILEALTK